jgi:hypothetical protein
MTITVPIAYPSPAVATDQPQQPQPQTQPQPQPQPQPQARSRLKTLGLLSFLGRNQKGQLPVDTREGKQFIDYATRCSLKMDPLTAEDMHTAKVVTKGIADTRAKLPLRGNVKEDITKPGYGGTYAIGVARGTGRLAADKCKATNPDCTHALTKAFMPVKAAVLERTIAEKKLDTKLAHPVAMGTGNCGEFAGVAARNIVGNLSQGDTASIELLMSIDPTSEKNDTVDHMVTKITPERPKAGEPERSVFIADAWADGPGTRLRDAPLTIQGPTDTKKTYSPDQGPKLLAGLDASVKAIPKLRVNQMAEKVAERLETNPIYADDPRYFHEIQTTSRQFDEVSRVAAISANSYQGPKEKYKAAVLGPDNYAEATSVNNMVPQLAAELGISKQDAANRVAKAINSAALEPSRKPEESWLTIEQP